MCPKRLVMAEFIYKSTIYGSQVFTVPDNGGVVELKGKMLSTFGGYLTSNSSPNSALRADAASLEVVARTWWKKRNVHLDRFGYKANGIEP
jgi:hypothetical protein